MGSTQHTPLSFPIGVEPGVGAGRAAPADTIYSMSDSAENPPLDSAAPVFGSTRDRILDAFAQVLGENGERAATLDAVAAAAGVSKGGLLYHFGSKEALIDGVLERLATLVERDVAAIRSSPSGPVAHLIRTSMATGSALDKALVATSRLAQASNSTARDALRAANDAWYGIVIESTGLSARIIDARDGRTLELGHRRPGRPDRGGHGPARRALSRPFPEPTVPGACRRARFDKPASTGSASDQTVRSISCSVSASISERSFSSSSSGAGESTVSTLSALPPATWRAICIPAMLISASPNCLP
jgi:AcrR family transcriptional regulator